MRKNRPPRECEKFGVRLCEALREAGLNPDNQTEMQRYLAVHGLRVTIGAVRKWLLGEAIPTQDKMTKLAHLLGKPPHWLRFGIEEATAAAPSGRQIAPRTLRALSSFELLAKRDQVLVQNIIDNMLEMRA